MILMHFLYSFKFYKEYSSKPFLHLFEVEIFSNILNVFTISFDKCNALSLNKSITFFLKGTFLLTQTVV